MRRTPGQIDQLFLDAGQTGLTVGARVLDNEGATTIARATGFTEFPAGSGLYYKDPFTFPTVRGTYTVLYDWDGGTAAPGFTASEDLEITSTAGDPFVGDTYAAVAELFRVLKIRAPSAEQTIAGERVLTAATYAINSEIDHEDDDPVSGAEISVAAQVCLAYACELWKFEEVQFGLVGIGSEVGATFVARDLWEKYAIQLAPIKTRWGIA